MSFSVVNVQCESMFQSPFNSPRTNASCFLAPTHAQRVKQTNRMRSRNGKKLNKQVDRSGSGLDPVDRAAGGGCCEVELNERGQKITLQ